MDSTDLFLLDDSVALTLWVGRGCPPELLQPILGVPAVEGVDCARLRLRDTGTAEYAALARHIDAVRWQRPHLHQ
eukprot:scaffold7110_cov67-Isochrysis_galbana.AAC.1